LGIPECEYAFVNLSQAEDPHPGGVAEMSPTPFQLEPMLQRTWELFRKHWLLLFAIHLTVSIPAGVLIGIVSTRVNPAENLLQLLMFSGIIGGLFRKVAYATIFAALSRAWSGTSPTYGHAWFVTMDRIGSVMLANVCVFILSSAGFTMCIAPGFLVIAALTFSLCAVMDEDHDAWAALDRSVTLVRSRFWEVFGYLALAFVPLYLGTAFVFTAISAIITLVVPALDHWLTGAVLHSLISSPILFAVVFVFVMFKALQRTSEPLQESSI
jgi:hypothetical protein